MNTQKQIFVIVVLLAIFTGGCAAYAAIDLPIRAERQADFFQSESVERGALLFANNCRTCHGARGQGGTGLPLNTEGFKNQDPLILSQNRDLLTTTMVCGRAGTLMPAWLVENGGSLNAIQIQHLVDLFTSPVEEGLIDSTGALTSEGWLLAVEFSENLNSAVSVVIGGDTLAGIASVHGIGPERLATENGLTLNSVLKKGDLLTLPVTGAEYKVGDGDTFRKISNRLNVGAMVLAELNDIDFFIDEDTGGFKLTYNGEDERLMLDPDRGDESTGLLPGTTLKLPANSSYTVIQDDTFESIAAAHGTTASALRSANKAAEDAQPEEDALLRFPTLNAYPVVVDSLADASLAFSAVSARTIAAANAITPEEELPVGKVLHMPVDAAGSAPPDTINDGSACVEHAIPKSSLDTLPGLGEVFEPVRPDDLTGTLRIVAHSNDWTFVNDGEDSELNEGVALIPLGTTITFDAEVGNHTIDINGVDVLPFGQFDEGETFTFTFDEPGEYIILCRVHPAMFGVVYVADS